ncbi:unnamed protein product [Mycena citricolor]|uniref:Uncharacterized protein n=1 Tax=Mycena citricolor TaxID=2018698 RepID=A0AAD2H8Q5_9AGAR|nr:unnamed protein product [Mycena citricolor]
MIARGLHWEVRYRGCAPRARQRDVREIDVFGCGDDSGVFECPVRAATAGGKTIT